MNRSGHDEPAAQRLGQLGVKGGRRSSATDVVVSSGSVGAHSRQACSTAGASSPAKKIAPPWNVATGTRPNSSSVTIPKLPLPPRTAQNRSTSSGSVLSARTSRTAPSAVTIVNRVTWSAAKP